MMGKPLRQRALKYEDSSAAMAFAVVFGFLAVAALGFYWLMQPTVYKNYGVAALKPPTNTDNMLWRRKSDQTVPPPPVTTGVSGREEATALAKADTKPVAAAAAPRPQYRPRPQPYPSYQGWNGFGRGFGFRW
jgi:hypothetical protein